MRRSVDYHERLIQSLKDPREAQAYLNAALEQDDVQMFLVALRNVAEAHGVRRAGRRKVVSPSIQEAEALLSRLGLRLVVEQSRAA